MNIWLINSAVIPADAYGTYSYRACTVEELTGAMTRASSRIGYEQTAGFIESITGIRPAVCRESYDMAPGDVAYVVRLRYRVDPASKRMRDNPAVTLDPANWELGLLQCLDSEQKGRQ